MKLIDNQTVQVDISYTENVKNTDGTVLSDLAYSSVYYQPQGALVPVMGVKTPATSPAGGGAVKSTLIVPAPLGTKTVIDFWATETDLTGSEGPPVTKVAFTVDRVAPAAPTGFTIA